MRIRDGRCSRRHTWSVTSAGAWLPDGGIGALRRALDRVAPDLATRELRMGPAVAGTDPPPVLRRGSAQIGADLLVKFAWSEEATAAIEREAAVLPRLAELRPTLAIPRIVRTSSEPLLVITRMAPGVVMGGPYVTDSEDDTVPEQLAEFLATLHDAKLRPPMADVLTATDVTRPPAGPDHLRAVLSEDLVGRAQAKLVGGWCDWIGDALRQPGSEQVVVHGDLHGHNLLLDPDRLSLARVLDFGDCFIGDPHFDFRFLVYAHRGLAWFDRCLDEYERLTKRSLARNVIAAWHAVAVLDDICWRTELGVPLAGGRHPGAHLEELRTKLVRKRTGAQQR